MKREFSIKDYINMLLAHIKLIIALTLLCSVVAYLYTEYLVIPVYSASAWIYVKNTDEIIPPITSSIPSTNSNSSTASTPRIYPSDMNTSAQLANLFSTIFKTSEFMKMVLEDESLMLEKQYTPGSLKSAVSFTSVNDTQVLQVSVVSTSANDVAQIANSVANNAQEYSRKFFDAGHMFTIEPAVRPGAPVAPNLKNNIIYGALSGFIVSVLIALLMGFIDTTVKPGDDLQKMYKIPVFAEIIDLNS